MGQSYTRLLYHIIFSTKNRVASLTSDIEPRVYAYIGGIIRKADGRLLVAGGTSDHVHLLTSLHPQTALADLMRLVKTNSSKWIHETFAELPGFAWQAGYAAFTVSQSNLDHVQQYIGRQKEHHRRVSFQEEFVAFLARHGVEFDTERLLT